MAQWVKDPALWQELPYDEGVVKKKKKKGIVSNLNYAETFFFFCFCFLGPHLQLGSSQARGQI